MALTQTQVSQLYVALFGRASEGAGNKGWIDKGLNQVETANEMIASPAAKDYFGGDLTNLEFVTFIYANTLGFTHDVEGIANWTAKLDAGISRGELVVDMITAALSSEYEGSAPQNQLLNRIKVSNYMATNVEKVAAEDVASTQFVSARYPDAGLTVNENASTVTAAEKIIDEMKDAPVPVPGEEYTLEVSRDKLTGTAKDDLFVADVEQNASGAQVNTLGSGDIINGGAGNDTLDATLIAAYNVAGKAMDITPTTKSIENIIINAQVSDQDNAAAANQQVILNARKMNGVEKISSKYSDANLLVKNMTTNGVNSTKDQTIAMEYTTNNVDGTSTNANMTVLYDQDYLTAGTQNTNGVYYDLMNQRTKDASGNALTSLVLFPLNEVEFKISGTEYSLDITEAESKAVTTYSELVTLLNSKLASSTVIPSAIKDVLNFSINGTFRDDENLRDGQRIELVSSDLNYLVSDPQVGLDTKSGEGNLFWERGKIEDIQTNDPVTINVELEKVGQAADGGALVIGSMNTDAGLTNAFTNATNTTATRAGFDQFDVVVKGDKSKNSSLSELASTNNTLRKVTIASETRKDDKYADLTIKALKDVQVVDASSFAGDLELTATLGTDIINKYLKDTAKLNLNGDLNLGKELALFNYKGGSSDDELNITIAKAALDNSFVATVLADGTNKNVFEMDINGGAGNDKITVTFDVALTGTAITNISINGGAGNDTIDITSQNATATYTVAFNGQFGHDIIKGFDTGVVTTTNEIQTLDLTNLVAHAGETINVTVGDKAYSYTIAAGTATAAAKAAAIGFVEGVLTGTANAQNTTQNTTDKYFTGTITGTAADTLTANVTAAAAGAGNKGYIGTNIETVKVEVLPAGHTAGSYDSTSPIHSFASVTTNEGGLLNGATGADVLDFSAYNAKAIVLLTAIDTTAGTVSLNGTLQKTKSTVANQIDKNVDFLTLVKSEHNDDVYDVYLSKALGTDISGFAAIDFAGTNANASKGQLLGYIKLDVPADWTAMDLTQLVY